MNRKFYLIDRENGNAKRRITLQEIADHFNGDGSGPVRWTPLNVDLDRFREEMDEIGYTFVIERTPGTQTARNRLRCIEARLATAYAKLHQLLVNRPQGGSDRYCRSYMERLYAQENKVEHLRREWQSAYEESLETPHRRRRS